MKPSPTLPHDATPADLARAIVHLRARGLHAEADYLKTHLPPAHLHHGQPAAPGFLPPNGASPAGGPAGGLSPHGVPHPDNPHSEGSLPPRYVKAYEVFGHAAPEPAPHKHGCVYLPIPEPDRSRVLALGKMIPDSDLADDGREADPHVTALYGLHDTDPAPVFEVLNRFRKMRLTLGAVSVFPGEEYDVVKIDVDGGPLFALNAALRALPHTNKFRDYRPHVTIAYVRPGLGPVYATRFGAFDSTCVCPTAVFSTPDRTKHVYPLGRKVTVEKAPMSYLSTGAGGALVGPAKQGRKLKLRRRITKALAGLEGAGEISPPLPPVRVDPDAPGFDAEAFVFGPGGPS